MLDREICHRARLARDARFDGRFFTAVKTTGIYCRPVCPATAPHERNVEYYATAQAAAEAGYRACRRCRPDSAPDSAAWHGTDTTLTRALRLIAEGALQEGDLPRLCERLGISDRHLRSLFQKRLGASPKRYALHRQCQFASQLLQQSQLTITEIAYASGFHSLRRFNDCFKAQCGLAPSDIRRRAGPGKGLQLRLYYRPPYAWHPMRQFLAARAISGIEWIDEVSYGRTFCWQGVTGDFTAVHEPSRHCFAVAIDMPDLGRLQAVIANIRRMLDLNADTDVIEAQLRKALPDLPLCEGLRLPGVWDRFEAGIRAILGQQVSVAGARNLVQQLCDRLGTAKAEARRCFPEPAAVAYGDLEFLKIPGARRETLRAFAGGFLARVPAERAEFAPADWLAIKGIGPWTVDYARMRGDGEPDIWLGSDLGVRKALAGLVPDGLSAETLTQAAPWRSYLTLHLWNR